MSLKIRKRPSTKFENNSSENKPERGKILSVLLKQTTPCFLSVFVSGLTGIRVSNVTHTSVRVDWNPVPELFILGYKVLVQYIPLTETLPRNKTYALVAGLQSNTKYTISILPVHGLTEKRHPVFPENAASIIVSTKRELGKNKLKILQFLYFVKFLHKADINARSIKFFLKQTKVVKVPGAIKGPT